MASFTSAALVSFFQLAFNGIGWPYGGSNLYVSLHNADPGTSGNQSTNETAYTNYQRIAVPISSGSWLVSSSPVKVQNISAVVFPTCGATGDTLSYWGLGTQASGQGNLLTSGPISVANQAYGFEGAIGGAITAPGLSPIVNSQVMAYGIAPGLLLPSGLTEGVIYYVGTAGASSFTLSTTLNNANPVNFTAAGTGVIIPALPLVVSTNIAPTFPAGNLVSYAA